jgi:hypothetical protein
MGVDFFAAAQVDLARNMQCIDELRVLRCVHGSISQVAD